MLKLIQADRPRLLIADEVGVGKTIEAGLILKELQARRDIRSVLVICPKPLVAATPIQLGGNDLYILLRPDVLPSRREFDQMAEPNPHINAAVEAARGVWRTRLSEAPQFHPNRWLGIGTMQLKGRMMNKQPREA